MLQVTLDQIHARVNQQRGGVVQQTPGSVDARSADLAIVQCQVGESLPIHVRYACSVKGGDKPIGDFLKSTWYAAKSGKKKCERDYEVARVEHYGTSTAGPPEQLDFVLSNRTEVNFDIWFGTSAEHYGDILGPVHVATRSLLASHRFEELFIPFEVTYFWQDYFLVGWTCVGAPAATSAASLSASERVGCG